METYLELGQIVNTYGIKGFLKIVHYTDNIKRFDNLKEVYIEKDKKLEKKQIEEVKYHNQVVLLKFTHVDTIEEAETYKGAYIKIDRKEAINLPKNSYFIIDLLESEVWTLEKKYIGKVIDVFKTGSNDVYVVKNELGKQILLPAIKSVIKHVDIENKKIIVELMKGLEE